ncbi:hypothetical protein BSLG_008532 [Batrachochytrium salamandrivorans]|nr:hypothetical protein BSLG_008532 [Batrachochytrium salamandrivorans]
MASRDQRGAAPSNSSAYSRPHHPEDVLTPRYIQPPVQASYNEGRPPISQRGQLSNSPAPSGPNPANSNRSNQSSVGHRQSPSPGYNGGRQPGYPPNSQPAYVPYTPSQFQGNNSPPSSFNSGSNYGSMPQMGAPIGPHSGVSFSIPHATAMKGSISPMPSLTATAIARKRTVRNIPLTPQGNLVIDIPVPDRVLHMGKISTGEEFTHMRYTAVVCPADDFVRRGIFRKALLLFEYCYNFIQLIFNWFALSSFYLTFTFLYDGFINKTVTSDGTLIVTGGLQGIDPFFGKTNLVFQILRQLYIFAIILIFISSMGNRPQGSKYIYVSSIFIFAVIMGSMIYLSGFSIFLIAEALTPAEKSSFITLWSANPAMRDMILSVGSTYGIYIVASIMHLDPWHMLTSFPQYMFFLPAFTNILNVYSFCNLHDVSWGTKGDNSASSLGGVKATKGKDGQEVVEVEVPTDHNDINANYENFIRNLRQPRPNEKAKRDAKTKKEDYFRNFRTKIVLIWMFMNAAVIVMFTTEAVRDKILPVLGIRQTKSFNPYLQFIFYSVLGLTLVRFIGSTTYLLTRVICG